MQRMNSAGSGGLASAAAILLLTIGSSRGQEASPTVDELLAKQYAARDAIQSIEIEALQFVRSNESLGAIKQLTVAEFTRLIDELQAREITPEAVKEFVRTIGPPTPEGDELMWPAHFWAQGDNLRDESIFTVVDTADTTIVIRPENLQYTIYHRGESNLGHLTLNRFFYTTPDRVAERLSIREINDGLATLVGDPNEISGRVSLVSEVETGIVRRYDSRSKNGSGGKLLFQIGAFDAGEGVSLPRATIEASVNRGGVVRLAKVVCVLEATANRPLPAEAFVVSALARSLIIDFRGELRQPVRQGALQKDVPDLVEYVDSLPPR